MALQLRTGPATEPVSLADAKSFLKVDGTDDDFLITSLITAARVYIETGTGKILVNEEWSFFKDKWPSKNILHLPLAPLVSIDAIHLHHEGGTYDVVPEEAYELDLVSRPGRLKWRETPEITATVRQFNHIEVRFTAGHGGAATDVPKDLIEAQMMLIAHWYEQREPIGFGGTFNEVPSTITAILANHKPLHVQ